MAEKTRQKTRRGLGRGLSALLGDTPIPENTPSPEKGGEKSGDRIQLVSVAQLVASKAQPRQNFADKDLDDLAKSLKKQGFLQPILVREKAGDKNGRYEIIAGERRWRAAQRAKIHEIPIIIRVLSDRDALEVALVENIQRADLNPIEEAEAYRRLMHEFKYTQEQLAASLGKSRSHIANMVRLEGLSPFIRDALVAQTLTMGHARALLGLAKRDADALARAVIADGLTVRAVEHRAAKLKAGAKPAAKKPKSTPIKSADHRAVERQLAQATGLLVRLRDRDGAGVVEIGYRNFAQLDGLIRRLTRD